MRRFRHDHNQRTVMLAIDASTAKNELTKRLSVAQRTCTVERIARAADIKLIDLNTRQEELDYKYQKVAASESSMHTTLFDAFLSTGVAW